MINPAWSENQRILYDFDIKCLELLKARGAVSTTEPSPLTREQIVPVLEAIAQAEVYQGQTVIVHDENLDIVVLKQGEVLPE